MNFLKNYYTLIMVVALLLGATSCGSNDENKDTAKAPAVSGGMNIRFVDEDSIMANYNLAKDYNEAMLRRQNQLDAAQKQRGSEISKLEAQIAQKYQNNGYLSEESAKADQSKYQKMVADAQSYIGNMQQSIATEMQQSNAQLMDSINTFMKEYAKQKGFDMILFKSAGVYMDTKFDVTKEVVEGLNKRYVKVKKEE